MCYLTNNIPTMTPFAMMLMVPFVDDCRCSNCFLVLDLPGTFYEYWYITFDIKDVRIIITNC